MNYSLAIFDLDGTLMDTSEGILLALRYTADTFGIDISKFGDLSCFIGPPIQYSIQKFWNVSKQTAEDMAFVFRTQYKNNYLYIAKPYDGIYTALETLQRSGLALAVATYKRQDYMNQLLDHFHFSQYMKASYGSDMDGKFTKADIIRQCYSDMSISPTKVLMIGDTDADALGADSLGIKFLGVTYGFGFRHKNDIMRFKCAVASADTPSQIVQILECI